MPLFKYRLLQSLLLIGAALVIAAAPGRAATISESPALTAAFKRAGVAGTFVMLDPTKATLDMHNPERARTRFLPAWYVGWTKRGGVIYQFALNIDTPDNEAATKRVPLAKGMSAVARRVLTLELSER